MSGEAAEGTDLFGGDDIVFFHEAVSLCEDGEYISIELHAQQHNQHPEEVGKEKTAQLPDADVLAEQFPNKSVHL